MASVVMLSSLFIETGPASGGWTIYPPLSALGDANHGIKSGNGFLDHGDGFVRGIITVRWLELYYDDSQYADEGNEYDQTAAYNLGAVLYRDPGCAFFPRTSFRFNIIVVRPACWYEFLSI